jgi:hypothetical protein
VVYVSVLLLSVTIVRVVYVMEWVVIIVEKNLKKQIRYDINPFCIKEYFVELNGFLKRGGECYKENIIS